MPATSSAGRSSKRMPLATTTIAASTRHRHLFPLTRQQPAHKNPANNAPRQSLRPLQNNGGGPLLSG